MRPLLVAAALLSLSGCELLFNGEKKFADSGSSSGAASTGSTTTGSTTTTTTEGASSAGASSGSTSSASASSSSGSSSGSTSSGSSSSSSSASTGTSSTGSSSSSGSTGSSASSSGSSSGSTTTGTTTNGGTTGVSGIFDVQRLPMATGELVTCSNAADVDGVRGPDLLLGLDRGLATPRYGVELLLNTGDGGFVDGGFLSTSGPVTGAQRTFTDGLPTIAVSVQMVSVQVASAPWTATGLGALRSDLLPGLGPCDDVEPLGNDLVLACQNGTAVAHWVDGALADGGNAFVEANFWHQVSAPILSAASGDLDGDGLSDLVWLDGAQLRVVVQSADAGFNIGSNAPCGGLDSLDGNIFVADLTGDGTQDMASAADQNFPDGGGASFHLFIGSGNNSPNCGTDAEQGDTPSLAIAHGIFLSGYLDVAALELTSGGAQVQLWVNDGANQPTFVDGGVVTIPSSGVVNAASLHVVDLDGDAQDDIVASDTGSEVWLLYHHH
ncbi:MAG: VCBS repeat-containing protein [Deltaproteobacteria bacterium]|nr:VCBS repeat-containing protein [Deltaproteobacteria bacterium]